MTLPEVLCIGASARAVAELVSRSGIRCGSIDLFADVDAGLVADPAVMVDSLDHVADALRACRDAFSSRLTVLLAGGMENHLPQLELLEAMPGVRIAGCSSESMRRARDPLHIEQVLAARGFPTLAVSPAPPADGSDLKWIVKPLRSGGGWGVGLHDRAAQTHRIGDCYWQEYRAGMIVGATFIAPADGPCEWQGCCCRQRTSSRADAPFRYEGSTGPFSLPDPTRQAISNMGRALADELKLRGWFGVDLVIDDDGMPWLLEINPRFTSSMELLDGRLEKSLLARHLGCFPGIDLHRTTAVIQQSVNFPVAAKQILFNDRDEPLSLPAPTNGRPGRSDLYEQFLAWNRAGSVRDVPRPGTVIAAGAPVCTVYAEGHKLEMAEQQLAEIVDEVVAAIGCGANARKVAVDSPV